MATMITLLLVTTLMAPLATPAHAGLRGSFMRTEARADPVTVALSDDTEQLVAAGGESPETQHNVSNMNDEGNEEEDVHEDGLWDNHELDHEDEHEHEHEHEEEEDEEGEEDEHEHEHAHEDEEDDEEGEDEHEDDEEEHQDSDSHFLTLNRIQEVGKVADKNGDQRLSLEEMLQFAYDGLEVEHKNLSNDTFDVMDTDKDGMLSFDEVKEGHLDVSVSNQDLVATYEKDKFAAADVGGDGKLDRLEFHDFMHPVYREAVLEVEVSFRMQLADTDGDGYVTLEEFVDESKRDDEDFSYEHVQDDFGAHDTDQDGMLNKMEMTELVKGHALIKEHVERAIEAADDDGDGHIHLHDELSNNLAKILDNEYFEDHFLVDHRYGSTEL